MARLLGKEQDAGFRLALDVRGLRLDDEQFIRLCRDNRDLRLELTAEGALIVMPPSGSETGWRESWFNFRLVQWSQQDGAGICFSSSAGFTLPNGARRAPDAAWVLLERWNRLAATERAGPAALCPDFVMELRSPSDRIADIQEKMDEYMRNGARLGWLLDPIDQRAWIYCPDKPPELLHNPGELSGGDVLPGFRFDFREMIPPRPLV
jgi:Uma2 family endonuclease